MKKLFLLFAFISLGAIATAQISSNALGGRLYGGDTFSAAELSYQKGLNSRNRLELDGSFAFKKDFTRIAIVGIYHWDWKIVGGLNWYVGPGASLSFDNYNNNWYLYKQTVSGVSINDPSDLEFNLDIYAENGKSIDIDYLAVYLS